MAQTSSPLDLFPSSGQTECERPSAGYHSSVWEEHFLPYDPQPRDEFEESAMRNKIEELKKEVKKILAAAISNDKLRELVFLIDDIQHLGIGYHFNNEIDEALQYVYQRSCKSSDAARGANDDVHYTAVVFVLLRKKGYNAPCSPDGGFGESIKHDTRALLSLYEATHHRGHGDYILEDALPFTLGHLTSVKLENLTPLMKYEISRALKGLGTRIRFERLEASHFIKYYQDEPSHNEVLLKLAKFDFNLLQKQHLRELGEMTRWWRGLEVKKNFPFIRDRLVEGYFWGLLAYQPDRAIYRIVFTKIIAMITIVDDTFDIYGKPEELELLAHAVERWDMNVIDELPANYLKVYYKALLDVYSEIEQNLPVEVRSYAISFGIKSMKDMVRAYHVESKWRHRRYMPTFEEYMEGAGYISSGILFVTASSFLGMVDVVTKDAFEWMFSSPKIVRSCQIIIRLLNDVVDYEMKIEEKLGQVKAVQCYMNQYDVTDTEAKKQIWKKINEAWKDVNDEFLSLMNMKGIPTRLLSLLVGITSMMTLWHEEIDIFTDSTTTMKDAIVDVLINSFPIDA